MTYLVGDGYAFEDRLIKDKQGLEYKFKLHYFFDEKHQCNAMILKLIRLLRDCEVGYANCLFTSPFKLMIADLFINNNIDWLTFDDKIFKLFHWQEPSNYRNRGLGTHLLKHIIEIGKTKDVQLIYGCLIKKDLEINSSLIPWFVKHGFRIEPPTGEDIKREPAIYRACLYLS